MQRKHLVVILVLLALVVPASPVHAGGVVTICDEAHLLAALAGGGTVTFSCSGTITLTNSITISADTTIDGRGQAVTISGNDALRVFRVNMGGVLGLDSLTIANGATGIDGFGGGAYNNGTLTVRSSTFSDNSASFGGGGVFNNGGTLTVSDSTFSDNNAHSGGAIDNNGGTVTVNDSTFSDNNAAEGGAIYTAGMLTVSNSIFFANDAAWGGGISGGGILTVSRSTFSANTGSVGGGGVDNGGRLTVSNSTFSRNSSSEYGGGIDNSGTLTVSNSTFFDNSAIGQIYSSGGGINNDGMLTVSSSTFSGNSVGFSGGGVFNRWGTVTLKNTIVANSQAADNCYGTITDGGGNLSYPDTTCPGINADPKLGPLQYNLGPTQTMALGSGSAAIDTGIDAICAAAPVNGLDQRGVARPWGAHCDIGAVEQVPIKSMWLPAILAR